eukprot:gnl/Spiro4/13192_TR6997_c0_g1_i1.p2 gnl/Spiro4/13192_TR6997_c0_g1~~gnl/Spiro4/13192_TR6997_c0_g1_i1.p2  ORF type:complete len:164 (+),score=9.41 gnl/Spiro4/13192_TR6997_c0_g1_i1:844-1335(+)
METKLFLSLAVITALIIGVWWYGEHEESMGRKAGAAEVQTQWDKDKEAIEKLDDATIAKVTKERDDALANNEGVQRDLQTQLDSARGLNTDLSNRLRAYSATARPSGVPQGRGGPSAPSGPAAPSVGSTDETALDNALGDALNECFKTRVTYEALLKELKPQL